MGDSGEQMVTDEVVTSEACVDVANPQDEISNDGKSDAEKVAEDELVNVKPAEEQSGNDGEAAGEKSNEGTSADAKPMETANEEQSANESLGDENTTEKKSDNEKLYENLDIAKIDDEKLADDKIFQELLKIQVRKVVTARVRLRSLILEHNANITELEIENARNYQPIPFNQGINDVNMECTPTDTTALASNYDEMTKQYNDMIDKVREKLANMKEVLKEENCENLGKEVIEIEKAIDSIIEPKRAVKLKPNEVTCWCGVTEPIEATFNVPDQNRACCAPDDNITCCAPNQNIACCVSNQNIVCCVPNPNEETSSAPDQNKNSSSDPDQNKNSSSDPDQNKNSSSDPEQETSNAPEQNKESSVLNQNKETVSTPEEDNDKDPVTRESSMVSNENKEVTSVSEQSELSSTNANTDESVNYQE